jgi:DNA invertase Pin-like site-specific DNA recombinase
MLIGYLRVSTNTQDEENQRHAISQQYTPDRWIAVECSSRKTQKARGIEELLASVAPGDVIIVTELSRLARSNGELILMVEGIIKKQVGLIVIKQGISIPANSDKMDTGTKVIVHTFGMMAELERDFISDRTKMALDALKAKGRVLGRPVGTRFANRLDDRLDEIRKLRSAGTSVAAIAAHLGAARTTLRWYLDSRGL